MSFDACKAYFESLGLGDRVREFDVSSATVALAAAALGTKEARIAKTLSFEGEQGALLVLAAGDAKIDNPKFKAQFARKAKMLAPEAVQAQTGHAIGGVCPFCLPQGVEVYMDESIKRFDIVYPACGSASSAVELTPDELFQYSGAICWVDVCKGWRDA